MSGSKPAPGPITYVPKPTGTVAYQSYVPEKDFASAEKYISELKAEREDIRKRRDAMVGSAQEIGQRMKERGAKEEAAYVSSLPAKETIPGYGKIDDANVVRDIVSQIVNRRADQAGLKRPDGTKGYQTPAAPKAAPIPKPKPAAASAPAPAPAPAPVVKKKETEKTSKSSQDCDRNPFGCMVGELKKQGRYPTAKPGNVGWQERIRFGRGYSSSM